MQLQHLIGKLPDRNDLTTFASTDLVILAKCASQITMREKYGSRPTRPDKRGLLSEMWKNSGVGWLVSCSTIACLATNTIHHAFARTQTTGRAEFFELLGCFDDLWWIQEPHV